MDLAGHVALRLAAALPPQAPVCAGLSGGMDSVVLLDLLARAGGRALSAVHVHHGLSPNADAWADFCAQFCRARDIALSIERVAVDRASPEGLEGAARRARYAVFAARAEPFVALAHHLDDQAETVLLQLLRGTGLKGLAAMPEVRTLPGSTTRLFRPLLAVPRAQLAAYATAAGLAWIEDESNAATAPDRNFLRHEVAPRLDARFAGWRDAAHRFARHAGGANALLDQLARLDGVPGGPGEPLPIAAALAPERRANALRTFLAVNDLPMPSTARLAEMARQLYEASPDARVRIDHGGVAIVRHRHAVHIERGLADPGAWRVDWHGELELDLGAGRGCVSFAKALGDGLARAPEAGADWYFRARAGGERIRLAAARPTRTLKNLLQEHRVPAWQRQGLPLLFHGGRLAWVPGIGIAAEFACGAAQEGFRPCWTVAGRAPLC